MIEQKEEVRYLEVANINWGHTREGSEQHHMLCPHECECSAGVARRTTMYPLNHVGARVLISLDRPALGGLSILIYRTCLSLTGLWSAASVLTSDMFNLAGSAGADVMIVGPTAPSYLERGLDAHWSKRGPWWAGMKRWQGGDFVLKLAI